jgi:hypothetical protein
VPDALLAELKHRAIPHFVRNDDHSWWSGALRFKGIS